MKVLIFGTIALVIAAEDAIVEVRRLEQVRDREAESVNEFKKRIRQVNSQIARLTGVAAPPALGSYMRPIIVTGSIKNSD